MQGEAKGHSGRAGLITLRQATIACGPGLIQGLTQGGMWSDEMIISAPPFEMEVKFAGQLGGAPRTPSEWSETTPQGEIDPFDESRLRTGPPRLRRGHGQCDRKARGLVTGW